MGLILILMWLAALGVLGLPSLVFSILVSVRTERGKAFWSTGILVATVSVIGQYATVLAPFVRRGTYSWDLMLAAIWGWQLLVPAVLAAITWMVGRPLQSAQGGVAAGLLLSIPLGIASALPVLFTAPALLGLRFEP